MLTKLTNTMYVFLVLVRFLSISFVNEIYTSKPHFYTEQKKKRNNRPPKIFEFNGKTLIISGLLLYDSHSWDIRVYHAKK